MFPDFDFIWNLYIIQKHRDRKNTYAHTVFKEIQPPDHGMFLLTTQRA